MHDEFRIHRSTGAVSDAFLELGVEHFEGAAAWVRQLPYDRNTDKDDPLILFREERGTCSTKHALLYRLALEQGRTDVRLFMGIFQMNRTNTPRVSNVLDHYGLAYIPEAHNYLKVGDVVLDCTRMGATERDFADVLLEELEITPEQVSGFKISYHRAYLERWLQENGLSFGLQQLWTIREACIAALSQHP